MRMLLNSSLLALTLFLAVGCQHGKSGCGSQSCGKQDCGRECGPQCAAPGGMARPYASAGAPATSGTASAYAPPSAPPRVMTTQTAAPPAYRAGDTAPPAPGAF